MKNKKLKTLLTSALLVSGSVLFGMLSLNNLTESKASNISISGDNGVDVYVSGEGVTYNDSTKKYEVQDGTKVTVTVVNDQRMFTSMKIGENEYNSSVVETTASGNLEIEIETTYSTAAHQGKCFGRAWSLSSEADITKLVNILNGTDPQYSYFAGASTLEDIQYGYYYVTNSIFYDVSNFETSFYGIGTTTNPFHGCIDFLNNYVSISSTTNGNINEEYAGFFGVVENGSGREINFGTILGENNVTTVQKECVLRNVSVKGNISFRDTTNSGSVSKLSVGGIAGKVSKDVILDNIDSSVSISVEASHTAVTAGAIFGTLETRIDTWENVKASGAYTTVKAISNGSGKDVYVGSLAGEVNNVSVYGFNNEISNGIYIANSLNNVSGNSIASSFVGVLNTGEDLVYENINFIDYENIDVSSVIKNSTGSSKNVYGALGFGLINGSSKVDINSIDFIYSSEKENLANLYMSSIRCSTTDVNSKGNAYAGGLIAYSNNSNVYWNNIENKTLYKTNVYIEAEVNGLGSAFAGGIFGYSPVNVDNSTLKEIVLNKEDTSIEVYANQLTSCYQSNNSDNIGVASGYYAPVLKINNLNNYLRNLELTVNNGILEASRQVGSKASGNIYAGGMIGAVYCGTTYTDQLSNLTINLNNSSVSGLGLSFLSPCASGETKWLNNVDVGGIFGHLDNCGSFTRYNATESSIVGTRGANNLNVNITTGSNNEEYAVKGIQNAAAGNHDHQNQGHIGGAIGMLRGGYVNDISVNGSHNSLIKPVVTFVSTNSPNTAAAGGIIGENDRDRNVLIQNVDINYIHVIARAFCAYAQSDEKYDVYSGGIIGVLANSGSYNTYLINSKITNTKVECVGEEYMLTYSGGTAGGLWWAGTSCIYNSIVENSEIIANSVSYNSFAGGLAGILQGSITTDNCYIINNYISASSSEMNAYAAGITARVRNSDTKIYNTYVNSTIVSNSDREKVSSFTVAYDGTFSFSNVYVNPENTSITEGTSKSNLAKYHTSSSNTDSEVRPLYIANSSDITYSVSLDKNQSVQLFGSETLPNNYVIRFSGDVNCLRDSSNGAINSDTAYTFNTVKAVGDNEGVVYVSLRVIYNEKEYELVNQPIYINKATNVAPDEVQLKNYSTKEVITNSNDQVAGYNQKENLVVNGTYTTDYYYAIVNVGQTEINGNKNAAQSIQISYSDFKNYNLYTTTAVLAEEAGVKNNSYLVPDTFNYDNRVNTILSNKKSVKDFNFFEYLIFRYEGSSVILTPRGDITESVYIIYEFGSVSDYKTVIIEFVPNLLDSIEIVPESYTNELGISYDTDGSKIYTYAPGDIINFKVEEHHRFFYEYSSKGYSFEPARNAYGQIEGVKKDNTPVILYLASGTGSGDLTVDTNGRTVIGTTSNIIGTTFAIKATSAINSKITNIIKIFVDAEVEFSYDASGAYFDSNRKVVDGTDFDFKVTPMAGYGLKPTKLNVILRTDSNSTTYDIKDLKYDLANSLLNQTVTANGINFNYSFNVIDGSYDITIPGVLFTSDISELFIDIEFGSTYNIVFDKGYEPPNGSGRYFIYQMTYGTVLDEDVYNQVLSYIGASQYGYEFQGYYLVQEGKTLNDYGYSFEEYCFRTNGAPEKRITGPMQFYARFTYEVIAMLPDIFELNTNLFIDEVMPLESNDPNSELIRIIPVDVNNGFTFTLKHDGTWYGDIPFEVYIIKKESHINVGYETINDETLTKTGVDKITDKVQTLAKNTYYIPPELINGYIVIRGFAEEMTFSCGESEVDTGIHDIYGDAIFTAMYSVTYNKEYAVDIKETVSYSNIEIVDGKEVVKGVGFGFKVKDSNGTYVPFYLPQNTSIRLYRFINHELYDVGVLVLKDGSKCEFFAHDFVDIRTGEQLALPNVTGVFDQKYNLVITLPNHEGIKQDYKNVEICLLATFKEHYNFYDYVNETVTHVSEDDSKAFASDIFNVYKTLGFTVTEGTNSFTFTKGKELDSLVDHRHENKYYVWKIAKTNPGFVEKINFGDLTPIVETNDAYYYLVTDGQTVTISQSDYNKLKGYTVAILEVENLQDPASGQLIYSKAIS